MTPARAAVLALALLAAAGCARKMPPPGGRPDVEPPRIVSTSPDSGAVGVSRRPEIRVVFSEDMRRDAPNWLVLGPYATPQDLDWEDGALRFQPAESLLADRTYTLVVGGGAVDTRGNPVAGPLAVPFTTGAAFPPGEIAGRVEARGHRAVGVFVWGYRDDLGHRPDSTARDFDALSVAGVDGRFRLVGLPVPSRWRLYAFHDANRTLTFEPEVDHLTAGDSAVALTAAAARADTVVLQSVDPRAPATVRGTVVDSLLPAGAALRVLAEPLAGPPGSAAEDRPSAGSVAVESGGFRLSLEPGRYRLRSYLDLDRDGRLDADREPAGPPREVVVGPGDEVGDVRLEAPRAPPGGTP